MSMKNMVSEMGLRVMNLIQDKTYAQDEKYYVNTRPSTVFMIKYFSGMSVVGCEIGVLYGENSLSLLSHLNIQRLFLVDPYIENAYDKKVDTKSIAEKNLRRYDSKLEWFVRKSCDAFDILPHGLEFIYIDGNHSYDVVRDDVIQSLSHVRKGGVVSGHDFDNKEVLRALFDVFGELMWGPNFYCNNYDWWYVKP